MDLSIPGSTCLHMQAELLDDVAVGEALKAKYKTVLSWNVYRSQAVRATAKRRKIAPPSCGSCGIALSRPFACLHCDFAGCWNDGHTVAHLRGSEHLFCADLKTGSIYCSQCDDFIYDFLIEGAYLEAVIGAEEKQTRFQVSQKLRDPYTRWVPEEKDKAAMENFVSLPCQGRRGLVNLGQTCFLNAVLQCLAHNPLLRNYFLSDKHNWRQCKNEHCTCCEMDKLFTEIYSEYDSPFSPTTFLHTLWKTSTELSGYAQQDAHECLITTLNQIHSTSRGSTNVSCNCIIHNTFGGQLQSEVKCERCGNVTTAVDPILDISLEVVAKGGGMGGSGGSKGDGPNVHAENTLAACLRRFTQPEKLGAKEYTCTKCAKVTHEASKRMSIRQLPVVLSFQFKRFEQRTNDKSSARKLDTRVRIPASINMAPYTSTLVREMDKENNTTGVGGGVPFIYPGPEVLYEYDLFAVINHEGQIDNGHYTNYARFEDEWYRFDDDKVTHSSLGDCLNSNPYMCFYVKRHLDYKPNMTPSYILMQKNEAQKEKERELKEVKERERELLRERERELLREKEKEREREKAEREREKGKDKEVLSLKEMEMIRQKDQDQEEKSDDDMMKEIDDALLATV